MFQNGGGIKHGIRSSIKPLPPTIATSKDTIPPSSGPNTTNTNTTITEPPSNTAITTIDKPSRDHLYTLLQSWLNHAKLPPSLHDTLIPVLLALVRSWLDAEHDVSVAGTPPSSPSSVFDAVYIQSLSIKSMSDSRFLPGVYHGDPLSKYTGKQIHSSAQAQPSAQPPLPTCIEALGGSRCEWLHHVVGGTIRIYGTPSGPSGDALVKIVCASVYTLWNLWLETHVLFDYQVRPDNEPTTAVSPVPLAPSPGSSPHVLPTAKNAILRWLFGSTKEGAPAPSAMSEASKKIIRRSTSFLRSNHPTPTTNTASLAACLSDYNDPNRFNKIQKYLESANLSSSPFCHYTTPQLFTRLQNEEDGLNTIRTVMQHTELARTGPHAAAAGGAKSKSFVQRTSSILSIRGHTPNTATHLPVLALPQSIAAYSPLRVPGKTCDNKLGLDQLFLETDSVDSFIEHQHLTFNYTCYPIGCPQHPCAGPVLNTVSFYSFDEKNNHFDQPIGLAIQRWCEQADKSCKVLLQQKLKKLLRPGQASPMSMDSTSSSSSSPSKHPLHGCDQPFKDHVMSFSHGNGRVQVYLNDDTKEDYKAPNSPSRTALHQYTPIDVWVMCSECDAATKPTVLSVPSFHYSLAKFFELVLYHTQFVPMLCNHVSEKKTHTMRCFRPHGSTVTVKMAYEDVSLYELRAPRLQVMPDAQAPRSTSDKQRLPVSKRALSKWGTLVAGEVNAFFEAVGTHFDVMRHYVQAESKREIREVQDNPDRKKALEEELAVLEGELAVMHKLFWETEHAKLTRELEQTPLELLNDFRRVFALRATAIVEQLTDWQKNKCKDLMDGCGWTPPDYIKDTTVHPFPGSSVLVREEEPSSIIAYTLSSSEYLDELRQTKNYGHVSIGSTAPSKHNDNGNHTHEPISDNVVDRYHSVITRKYVAPNKGAASETASFRTMVLETVKTNAEELHYQQQRRLQGIKERWVNGLLRTTTASDQVPQEEKTQRILMNEPEIQGDHGMTTEVKRATYENKPLPQPDGQQELSPHIKHKFTHNDMEFTCIVYYAAEFESLRRQCGIDQLLIQSLTRCTTWKTSGGKSKSHFYKSHDDRLVIKEMVNAWNNIEKESILKFAPKYFEHMKKSMEVPSMLAKIFGFYTIRIKNASDKRVFLDLDVLVMEHLFYGVTPQITRRFDFKGIRDRHVEQKSDDSTLWDGDWIEGFRLVCPVGEQSKALIKKAIQNDTAFLESRNIMDYSLLLGIDEQKKELTVGIVDFIGAYTWYKKVESKSKSTLHPNKEVTVVPPEQYKWRFCRMADDYFISIPGKFDRIKEDQTTLSTVML